MVTLDEMNSLGKRQRSLCIKPKARAVIHAFCFHYHKDTFHYILYCISKEELRRPAPVRAQPLFHCDQSHSTPGQGMSSS
jgi:replicative superfamily II helicase